jgi:hypothetical protein
LEVSRLIDDLGLQDRQQYVCASVALQALLLFFKKNPFHIADGSIYVSA